MIDHVPTLNAGSSSIKSHSFGPTAPMPSMSRRAWPGNRLGAAADRSASTRISAPDCCVDRLVLHTKQKRPSSPAVRRT